MKIHAHSLPIACNDAKPRQHPRCDGSIGESSLRVIAQHPKRFQIAALTPRRINAEKLIAPAQQ